MTLIIIDKTGKQKGSPSTDLSGSVATRPDSATRNLIQATTTGIVPLILKQFPGSTADNLRIQDHLGNVMAGAFSNGAIYAGTFQIGGSAPSAYYDASGTSYVLRGAASGSPNNLFQAANAAHVIADYRAIASQSGALIRTRDYLSATQMQIAANGRDFIFDTAVGNMLGTATNQKLSLWGKTPITQPTALTAPDNGTITIPDAPTAAIVANMRTRINELETKLKALGVIA